MRRVFSFKRHHFGVRNHAPWRQIFSHTFHQFHENDLFTSAAAMSYFALLTLFPALILLLALGNKITAGTEMMSHLVQVFPGSSDFLRSTVRSLTKVEFGVVVSCLVVVLWAGSWIFTVAERALNRIWKTTSRPFLHGRALTIGMLGIVGCILLLSVIGTSILVGAQQMVETLSPKQLANFSIIATIGTAFWQIILTVASILISAILFMLVYRFMPNAPVTLLDALPGAVVASIFWEVAKYFFARSLQYFHYDQIYGSVGAVIAVLTWSYVSSLILLFGAQLTAVCHREHPFEIANEDKKEESDIEVESLPSNVTPIDIKRKTKTGSR
jgi:membrane protein